MKRNEMPKRWKEGQATGPLALCVEFFFPFKRLGGRLIPKKAVHLGREFEQLC